MTAEQHIYLAEFDSEHFSWRAVGNSATEALQALAAMWDANGRQIGADNLSALIPGAQAVEEYGATVTRMAIGVGYRDGAVVR